MKKTSKMFAVLFCLTVLIHPLPVEAIADSAQSIILMDAGSGRILFERNAHQPRMIASITKLMTALVALNSEHDISEVVTISPEWVGAEGSSLYLRSGEQLQLKTLLYGLMLQSGNDAALAVAGYCEENVDAFVQKMNKTAAELGMNETHFCNPSGLTEEEHFSSAYDMALLARACLKHPILSEIVATKAISLEGRSFRNHNKLLWQYEGCIGLKTGYTEKAGRTLVSAAQRNGLTLICVTLHAPNDWQDHKELLDYGFANYQNMSPHEQGAIIGVLPVYGSLIPVCPIQVKDSLAFAIREDECVEVQIHLDGSVLEAPVAKNVPVGKISYRLNGEEITGTQIITAADIPDNLLRERNWFETMLGKISFEK